MSETRPILYSFRRCPYAMRARWALHLAKIDFETREVDFKNKPAHLLEVSPKGTVPVLLLPNGSVIDESLDVLDWALKPEFSATQQSLIQELTEIFIPNLNRYKYPSRYEDAEPEKSREICEAFLGKLNALCVKNSGYLAGQSLSALDIVIFPLVRQFRIVSEDVFNALPYNALKRWASEILQSEDFMHIMKKD